jgi:membrane associated rhomboid family serine protease
MAKLTGRTETQVAWRLQQGRPGDSEAANRSGAGRAAGGFLSLVRDSLPDIAQHFPATFFLGVAIGLWYVVGVLLTGGDIAAMSAYTLRHLGATHGVLIASGEWWRILMSNFVHHDLMHLAFNLYALMLAGRFVELLYGSGRTVSLFVWTGAAGMGASFWYYTYMAGQVAMTSGGASAAVSGLIGAALIGGHRERTTRGIAIRDAMLRWAVFLVLWGVLVPFVNNMAHGGGFVAGLVLGAILPVRDRTGPLGRATAGLSVTACVVALALTLHAMGGRPAAYEGMPRHFFGKLISGDADFDRTLTVKRLAQRCESPPETEGELAETIDACERVVAIDPARFGGGWKILSLRYRQAEREADAERADRAWALLSGYFE